ncbi:MAG TPA: hypothetical protein VKV73_18855 [Chloroflexota bacterium]|nr:hypothetical protein [Chloroflexota bacterium]
MTTSLWKRSALAIGGAALLLSATIGFSQAQTATPTPATAKQQHRAAVLDLAAAKLGVTSDQLTTALKDARKDLGARPGAAVLAKLARHELSVAATTLGIADVKTLRQELAGTTLTAVAGNHGVPAATVAAALKADVEARIQALLAAGTIKADRAAALKVKADAKVDALMTRQFKAARTAA